jgi:hypothetical protein
MNNTNYVLLGLLALSVVGNIVQSQRYDELLAQSEYIYEGTVEHIRATLQRELTAIAMAGDEQETGD